MTTGMSAPPMGITNMIPSREATPTKIQNGSEEVGSPTSQALRPRQTSTSITFITCRPGNKTGRSLINP